MVQGRFPIIQARQELGVTPTTAVRADIDVRTGEGAVGAAIGQGLIGLTAIGLQIREKRQQMTDANSAVTANKLREIADSEFETFKLTNPQETWQPFRQKQTQGVGEEIAKLNFSPNALVVQRIKSEAYSETQTARALTDATRQLRTDTIQAQTEVLVDAFRSGNPQEILDATKRYNDNGANMGKDKAEILSDIKAAKEAGEKLRKEDTLKSWRSDIAEKPIATAEVLNNELAARQVGKGVILEAVLTSADIQSLLNTATNRQTQLTASTQAELNARNAALETQLHDDILTGKASITEVANSSLPAAAKRRLERDLTDVAERDIARTWAIQDGSGAITVLNSIRANIEAGLWDVNEGRRALHLLTQRETPDGRSIVTKKTFDKTMEQISRGGRDAIDLFSGEQTAKVENSLTGRLTEESARLTIKEKARTLTPKERRQFSTVGFLLQVANHQVLLYEEGLAQRLRVLGIEDTSGKEAKAEAVKVWESIRRKSLETRINDFLVESGEKLVRPSGFPEEMWESANARNRAMIVNAISKGYTKKEIMEVIIK